MARMAWLAAAVLAVMSAVAVVGTPLDGPALQKTLFNESMELENPWAMTEMLWLGPARGCAVVEGAGGAGGAGGAVLQLECTLPAAHLTLTTDRAATFLSLKCEKDVTQAAKLTCEDLWNNTSEVLRNHTSEALGQRSGARVLPSLSLSGCELQGPLQCLLDLVNATDVSTLILDHVSEPLRPDQVEGLDGVKLLQLLDVDANITSLPYAALAFLPALRRLNVHGGALQLPAGGAGWLQQQQMQMLELVAGQLRELPEGAFLGLSELRNLSLWGNQIETIHENAFKGLSHLECLALNQNRLRALPAGALLPAPRLALLHLYRNPLAQLPHLAHLTHLQEIWLNNYNETSLVLHNDTFAGLSSLRKLKLEACGVTAAPARLLAGCGALRELSLAANMLAELPAELLAAQPALRALDLAGNRLRTLPTALLAGARALEELRLQNNLIDSLPNGLFLNLAALKKLDLSHNKLQRLSSRVFEGLSSMREVSLAYNNLSLPAAEARSPLAGLQALTHVRLAHNRVRAFMEDWRDLHHLEALDLSYNEISELSDIDLQLLSEAVVDLRHNNISLVRQMSPAELDAVGAELSGAVFKLDDNPFRCDCYMFEFVAALRRPAVAAHFEVERARCAAPPAAAGARLAALDPGALLCPLAACPAACRCAFRAATRVVELDCAAAPRPVPPVPRGARGLRLRLRSPIADLAALPPSVRELDLSGLRLTVAPRASRPVPHLTVDLSNNSLTSAPLDLLDANATVVLAGNPLACDCAHQAAVLGVRRRWARVADGTALRCADGELLSAKDADALCAPRDALALGLGSGLAVALLVVLLFKFRTEIRLILGRFSLFDFLLPKRDLGAEDKKYDAFVSFSHHDEAFVREVLVPALEAGRRPLRLCLHYRDWEVGDLIPEQIDRSVRHSWRTIVVLSEDFVRSVWGRHEFRAAHGLERVIVLVLGDALRAMDADSELRAYKKTHTCIMASHPLVWDRIRDAVYRSKCAAPEPAPKGKGGKPSAGLNVQLCNGKLVNESDVKAPQSDGDAAPERMSEKLMRWLTFNSKDHNENKLELPK